MPDLGTLIGELKHRQRSPKTKSIETKIMSIRYKLALRRTHWIDNHRIVIQNLFIISKAFNAV